MVYVPIGQVQLSPLHETQVALRQLFTTRFNIQTLYREYSALKKTMNNLRGLSPRANYTDRSTAACRRS
jgi:hypothetical protein